MFSGNTFSDDFPRDFRFHEDASTTTLLWHTVRPCPCWYFSSTKNRFFVISMFPAHDFRTDKIQDCIGNKDGFRSQNSPNVISTRQQGRTVMLFEGWSPRFAKGFVFPYKIRSTWMQEKSLHKPKLHRKLRCTSSFVRCIAPRLLRISFGCSLYSFPLVQGMLYTAHCFFSRNSGSSFQINQKTSSPRNKWYFTQPILQSEKVTKNEAISSALGLSYTSTDTPTMPVGTNPGVHDPVWSKIFVQRGKFF